MKVTQQELNEALNRVASTDDGRIVLAAVKDACKWDMTYRASDNPVESHAHALLRGVYGGIRKRMSKKNLVSIEYDYKFEVSDGKE